MELLQFLAVSLMVWELFSINFSWASTIVSAGKDAPVIPESRENCIKGYNEVSRILRK